MATCSSSCRRFWQEERSQSKSLQWPLDGSKQCLQMLATVGQYSQVNNAKTHKIAERPTSIVAVEQVSYDLVISASRLTTSNAWAECMAIFKPLSCLALSHPLLPWSAVHAVDWSPLIARICFCYADPASVVAQMDPYTVLVQIVQG